jgi:ribosome-associated protein
MRRAFRAGGRAGTGRLEYDSGMVNPAAIDDVSIGGEAIRLGQFLKFAGLLDSGGDVKEAIIDGYVTVNGEVDRRRGRQLQLGDVVGFEGHRVRVCR